jgi:hypothetical protein
MKKILSFLFVITVSITYSQTDKKKPISSDTSECLTITGNFDGTVKDLEGNYKAKLMKDNKVIDEQELKVKKSFEFTLKKNMLYAIRVEKEGYIPKLISISTTMSSKIMIESPYKFNFETNLLSQDLYGHFDDDDVDFPVALVSYGKKCDCFEYNRDYTAKLINRMYTNLLFGSGTD